MDMVHIHFLQDDILDDIVYKYLDHYKLNIQKDILNNPHLGQWLTACYKFYISRFFNHIYRNLVDIVSIAH